MSINLTLDQSIGWIMSRSQEVVDALATKSLLSFFWYKDEAPFHFNKKFLSDERELLNALKFGKIIAKGRANGVGNSIVITHEQWHNLSFKTHIFEPTKIVPDFSSGGTWYSDVTLCREALELEFPSNAADSSPWLGKPAKMAIPIAAAHLLSLDPPEICTGWIEKFNKELCNLKGIKGYFRPETVRANSRKTLHKYKTHKMV